MTGSRTPPLREVRARLAREYDEGAQSALRGRLCGVDEAGRGPLAGPVVAAAVLVPAGGIPCQAYDSKALSRSERERVNECVWKESASVGVGVVDPDYIDRYNILQATHEAMRRAVASLSAAPDFVLVDGALIPELPYPQRKLIRGDQLSQAIAAASIVAKVARDRMMAELDSRYPGYGFARNAGYGTPEHLSALERLGPTPVHRMTFTPVRERGARTGTDSRNAAGARAEDAAVDYLLAKGYRILVRNWRVAVGELDAVMADGSTLVFVEVRSRREGSGDPIALALESVDADKRGRLRALANWFLQTGVEARGYRSFRFDVVAVSWRKGWVVEHCPDAF